MSEQDEFRWYLPSEAPLALTGFAWFAQNGLYRRLPKPFRHAFSEGVEYLADNTAGGQIRFRSDSRRVAVRVTLAEAHGMDHMPATGQCGFDCYVGQRFVGVTRFSRDATEYQSVILHAAEVEMRDITINFPLYQSVNAVHVGLDPDAQVLPPAPYDDDRPIVVYGTSITQGGCACRPGMLYTNILGRKLNRPFINLGFSGNGKGEPEVAEALAEIADPAAYILDYEANAGLEGVTKTLEPFIGILRAAHPAVPILVVSRIRFAQETIDPDSTRLREQARDVQRDTVARLRAAGDPALFFHDGAGLLGDDFDECCVDGVHPTDLGFLRIAEGLLPVVRKVLGVVAPV